MLDMARGAWLGLSGLRARRRRFKAFTYGRQWGDTCRLPDGRIVSEEQRISEEGRIPVTNNIIRQTVKSIIGRYRYMCTPSGSESDAETPGRIDTGLTTGSVSEEDARALEEFLISGCAVQRLERGRVENISPERVFFHEFRDTECKDLRMVGILHDMSPADAVRRFSKGSSRKAREVKLACARAGQGAAAGSRFGRQASFNEPELPDTWRVIEIWRLTPREILKVHDPFKGGCYREHPDALERLEGLNRARRECDSALLEWRHEVEESWEVTWLTPKGDVLLQGEAETCPIVMKLCPLIDGEVHSLVEDVIDQQKYVNRLISMLDHIISSSAKGVLLYPADQLPDGFTWKDLRRIWSNPMGILPYKRTSKTVVPQQVHSNGATGSGATEMLKMQLQLFDEISGATGALRGKPSAATGEGMLRAELENSTISMLDVLAAFRQFVIRRDELLKITD